jgi:hypothetical protein
MTMLRILQCMQVGNLKGDSAGAVATHQHLQRRRKNLTKVLEHVKVRINMSAVPKYS